MHLDIAIGLLIGGLASLSTGDQYLSLMLFGVFATLAPDLDFIVWLVRNRWKVDQFFHEHRDLLHQPLLFGLGGGLLIGLWSPLYGLVWFLGTMAHFIHDTFDGGWGIAWLHPFYLGYFTLASYSPKRHIRDFAEQRAIATVHGNPNPHWLGEQYLKPNTRMLVELGILVGAMIVAVYWFLTRSGA